MAAVGGPPAFISIPSQHIGNCASDTIQIVMFFADDYKDYFREIAIFISPLERRPFLELFKRREFLVYDYIYTAARRYSHLGSVNRTSLLRSESPKLYGSINTGPRCSTLLARVLGRKVTKKNAAGKNILNLTSWGYSSSSYTDFMNQLFNAAKKLKFAFDIRSNPYICFSNVYDPANGLRAVQFFTVPKSRESFHTFCLLVHNGQFYIGDNMLGFLIQANHIEYLGIHNIGVNDEILAGSYKRTFFWWEIRGDVLHKVAEIASITRPVTPHIGIYNEVYLETSETKVGRVYFYFNPACPPASSRLGNNINALAGAAAAARVAPAARAAGVAAGGAGAAAPAARALGGAPAPALGGAPLLAAGALGGAAAARARGGAPAPLLAARALGGAAALGGAPAPLLAARALGGAPAGAPGFMGRKPRRQNQKTRRLRK